MGCRVVPPIRWSGHAIDVDFLGDLQPRKVQAHEIQASHSAPLLTSAGWSARDIPALLRGLSQLCGQAPDSVSSGHCNSIRVTNPWAS
jgi:hypothetical protein